MRQFERQDTRIEATVTKAGGPKARATVFDISGNGVAIASPLRVALGDEVRLDLDGGARFPVVVTRVFHAGFGARIMVAPEVNRLLALQVAAMTSTRYYERRELPPPEKAAAPVARRRRVAAR